MNRDQEIAAIDTHIAIHGLYQCAPGESFYGDENIPLRDRMANFCRNRGRPREARVTSPCQHCGKPITRRRREAKAYCDKACFAAARRASSVAINCATCGKELHRPPSRAGRERMYCDNACRWGPARAHGRKVAA